jgi:hypothetical protein
LGTPEAGESEQDWMARCQRDGGSEETCMQLWTDSHPVPMPKGIPLRPDHGAAREAAMNSIVRACLATARSTRDPSAYKALAGDRPSELLTRSATAPTTLASAAALAQVAMHFVASLTPISAAAAVISRSLQLTFDHAARISVPALTLPHAAWLAEGGPVPFVQGTSSPGAALDPFRLAAGVVLTGEMIRNSNAEAFVRQVLLESVGPVLDAALFSAAAAVSGVRPAGILNGIASLTPVAGGGFGALTGDLAAIAAALGPAAGGSQPVLVASPAQVATLTLCTPRELWPVFPCAALPAKTIVGLVPAALATSIDAPRIESSGESVVHLDDAPTDIGLPGTPPTVAARSYSVYQADSAALKFVLPVSWSVRSPAAVAWVSNTSW